MEPQIIDHYTEMPYGINVISKMDEEYEVSQTKIKELEEENKLLQDVNTQLRLLLLRFIPPKVEEGVEADEEEEEEEEEEVEEEEEEEEEEELIKTIKGMRLKASNEEEDVDSAYLEDWEPFCAELFEAYNKYTSLNQQPQSIIHRIIDATCKYWGGSSKLWCEMKVLTTLEIHGFAPNTDNAWQTPRMFTDDLIEHLTDTRFLLKSLKPFNILQEIDEEDEPED